MNIVLGAALALSQGLGLLILADLRSRIARLEDAVMSSGRRSNGFHQP